MYTDDSYPPALHYVECVDPTTEAEYHEGGEDGDEAEASICHYCGGPLEDGEAVDVCNPCWFGDVEESEPQDPDALYDARVEMGLF